MILSVASPVVAQPTTGWTFDVLTIWNYPKNGWATVKREPYGVFASTDECRIAQAKKNDELDQGNYRQPHLLPNAPVYRTTLAEGARSITTETPGGPTETMSTTDCRTL
jgi:hypothetical protein